MLPEITTENRMDKISTMGYAFGYIGSVIPFIVCLVLVLLCDSFGLTQSSAMTIAFLIIAFWWLGCSLPLLKKYRQTAFLAPSRTPIRDAFRQLAQTLKAARKEKHIFLYPVGIVMSREKMFSASVIGILSAMISKTGRRG